jgi:hypothetical protein
MAYLRSLLRNKSLIRQILLVVAVVCVCPLVAQVLPSPVAIALAAEFTFYLDLAATLMAAAAATRLRGALSFAAAWARVQAHRTRLIVRRTRRAVRRRAASRLRPPGSSGSTDDEPGGFWAASPLPA